MPPSRFSHKQTLPQPPNYLFGFIFIILQLIIIGFTWMQLPPQLPLYYSLPYGFGQLISKSLILIIPGISLSLWLAGFGLQKIRIASPIYRHTQFWIIQLILFLHTIALIHSVLIIL